MKIIKKIFSLFTSRQQHLFLYLIFAMLINSVFEVANIGLILPLIKFVNNPSSVENYPILVRTGAFFGITNPRDILILFVCGLLAFFIFKSVYVVGLNRYQLRFVSNLQFSLSSRLLRVYLFSPWTFFLKSNSADLLNNVINRVGILCTGLISPLFILFTESLISVSILILLLVVEPFSTGIAIVLLGAISLIFFRFIKNKIKYFGIQSQECSARMIKSAQEAFGGIKETKILNREDHFIKSYEKNLRGYTQSWVYVALVSQIQRSILETFLVGSIIIVILVVLLRGAGGLSLMSSLALFAVAAIRLMPTINRIISSISNIRYHYPALDVVHNDLNLPNYKEIEGSNKEKKAKKKLLLQERIDLENVSFKYPDAKREALSRVSLSIPKGYSVAFIGPSGAGKTSLVDIILGLLNPTSGKVEVDGRDIKDNIDSWRQQIGYIPQFIYLSDNTIRRNVAFGIDDVKIDDKKVWKALKYAQLEKFVRKLPDGLDTIVGEHGARLSGGELQRIGIARALYHDPKILVLDEATSHLDIKTEKEIMNTIEALKGEKTLLIITHRPSTIENCDIKYTIKSGKITETTYSQQAAL